jgi:hypothetical protein
MANTYRIQVLTKEFVPEVGLEYSDAQYFDIPIDMTIQEFQQFYEAEIETEKSTRINSFIANVKNSGASGNI